jgi:hypothetical protein
MFKLFNIVKNNKCCQKTNSNLVNAIVSAAKNNIPISSDLIN